MSKRGHDDCDSDEDGESRSCKRGNFITEEQNYQTTRDLVFHDVKPQENESEKAVSRDVKKVESDLSVEDLNATWLPSGALRPQILEPLLRQCPEYCVWIDWKPQGFWMLRASPQRLMYFNHRLGWSLGIIPMDIHASK